MPASAGTEIHGTVHNVMVAHFTKEDTSNKAIETLNKIAREDPKVKVIISGDNINVSQDMGASDQMKVEINNKAVKVDHGEFSTKVNDGASSKIKVSDSYGSTTISSMKNSTHMNAVHKISFSKVMESMVETNERLRGKQIIGYGVVHGSGDSIQRKRQIAHT